MEVEAHRPFALRLVVELAKVNFTAQSRLAFRLFCLPLGMLNSPTTDWTLEGFIDIKGIHNKSG